jgi:antitoxin MazE
VEELTLRTPRSIFFVATERSMRTSIQKWGNSLAVRIPRAFAADLGIDKDAAVDLTVEGGALVLRPSPVGRYDLESLLAEVTDENVHPVVDWGALVGREVL